MMTLIYFIQPNKSYMKILLSIITLFSILFLTSFGCSSDDTTDEAQLEKVRMWHDTDETHDAYIIGIITHKEDDPSPRQLRVEENPEITSPNKPEGDKMWLSLPDDFTEVFIRNEDGSTTETAASAFHEGQIVSVWRAKGQTVLLSYRGQAPAKRVPILNDEITLRLFLFAGEIKSSDPLPSRNFLISQPRLP